jgi:hypothetical protein
VGSEFGDRDVGVDDLSVAGEEVLVEVEDVFILFLGWQIMLFILKIYWGCYHPTMEENGVEDHAILL